MFAYWAGLHQCWFFGNVSFPVGKVTIICCWGRVPASTTCLESAQRQLPRVKTIVSQLGKCKFAIMSVCIGAAHFEQCQFSSSRSKVCMPPLRCCNRSCIQVGGWGAAGAALVATESHRTIQTLPHPKELNSMWRGS